MGEAVNIMENNHSRNPLSKVTYNLAQDFLTCAEQPSLERLSLIQIAISLWQQKDIRDKVTRYDFTLPFKDNEMYSKYWSRIQRKVLVNANQLSLNVYCKKTLVQLIEPIGVQILKFLTYEHFQFDDKNSPFDANKIKSYMDHLCWTSQGTINKSKTALLLIETSNFRPIDKYFIACNYCLKEKIRIMRQELTGGAVFRYIKENFKDKYFLVLFWTFFVIEAPTEFDVFFNGIMVNFTCQNIFQWALANKNEGAVQYIWENLCDDNLIENIASYAVNAEEYSINIIFYLLSNMIQTQEHQLPTTHVIYVLKRMLMEWRWHKYFFPTLKYWFQMNKLTYLELIDFSFVCKRIFNREQFIEIFNESVYLCPLEFSFYDAIFERSKSDKWFSWFIICKRRDFVNYVLRMFTAEERRRAMYTNEMINHISELIIKKKFKKLNRFLDDMLDSEEEINDFKKSFLKKKKSAMYYITSFEKALMTSLKIFHIGGFPVSWL